MKSLDTNGILYSSNPIPNSAGALDSAGMLDWHIPALLAGGGTVCPFFTSSTAVVDAALVVEPAGSEKSRFFDGKKYNYTDVCVITEQLVLRIERYIAAT